MNDDRKNYCQRKQRMISSPARVSKTTESPFEQTKKTFDANSARGLAIIKTIAQVTKLFYEREKLGRTNQPLFSMDTFFLCETFRVSWQQHPRSDNTTQIAQCKIGIKIFTKLVKTTFSKNPIVIGRSRIKSVEIPNN